MFKKVMVVIDADADHQVSLDKALKLAKQDDFELILLSCDHTQYLLEGYYFDGPEIKKLRSEYLAERKALLEKIAEPLRENGLVVNTVAEWSYPNFEGIVARAKFFDVDLIIHHVIRHGALSRLLLTHDDWQLLRFTPAPLLIVKDKPWKDQMAIVAAVDPFHARHKPSGLDHKILNVSQRLVKLLDGNVLAVHAYRSEIFSGTYPLEARAQHQAAFKALMDDVGLPEEQRLLVEEAPVFALRQAEELADANVVVMGGISRSMVADLLIGSTTEQVVDYLSSDVLVLKPDDVDDPRKGEPS